MELITNDSLRQEILHNFKTSLTENLRLLLLNQDDWGYVDTSTSSFSEPDLSVEGDVSRARYAKDEVAATYPPSDQSIGTTCQYYSTSDDLYYLFAAQEVLDKDDIPLDNLYYAVKASEIGYYNEHGLTEIEIEGNTYFITNNSSDSALDNPGYKFDGFYIQVRIKNDTYDEIEFDEVNLLGNDLVFLKDSDYSGRIGPRREKYFAFIVQLYKE